MFQLAASCRGFSLTESNPNLSTRFENLASTVILVGLSKVNQMFSYLIAAWHGPLAGHCCWTEEAGVKWFEKPCLCRKKIPETKGKGTVCSH